MRSGITKSQMLICIQSIGSSLSTACLSKRSGYNIMAACPKSSCNQLFSIIREPDGMFHVNVISVVDTAEQALTIFCEDFCGHVIDHLTIDDE